VTKGEGIPVDRRYVGTLHALCYQALGRPTVAESQIKEFNKMYPQFALGQDARNASDTDDNAAEVQSGGTIGDELFGRLQLLRAKLVDPKLWPESVVGFAKVWEEWKYVADCIDFTDMIDHALRDVAKAPGEPDIGVFDESQDFVPMQLALIRKWSKEMRYIVLAGDDDQCVYRFSGASPDAFLNPPIPDSDKVKLSQSWRIPRAVHELSQRWVSQLSSREPKEYRPRTEEGEITRLKVGANFKHPEEYLDEMLMHVDSGKSVMFIASCSYMLQPFIALLRSEGIPFHNPYRRRRGDWNPLHGSGISGAQRLIDYLQINNRLWTGTELYNWLSCCKQANVMPRGCANELKLLNGHDSTIEMEDLDNFFLQEREQDPNDPIPDWLFDGANIPWLKKHLLKAKEHTFDYPSTILEKRGIDALKLEPKIIVGTIHSVKGGEADVCYLVPDLSMNGMEEYMTPGEARDSVIRLMYVAMTRTRETLNICAPVSNASVQIM
jgi:superfamily I DNA/RNA helicase